MGTSFGGTTVTGFMRKYSGVLSGGISWNGGLCYKATYQPCAPHLEACSLENLSKLRDPLLILQAWNDNTAILGALKMFLERAEHANKAHLIHPFMIKMANETVETIDKQNYIGHFLNPARSGDLDRIIQQVLIFIANPSKSTALDQAIDKRRAHIIKDYASLNSKQLFPEDTLKGMTRKWYEEHLYANHGKEQEPVVKAEIKKVDLEKLEKNLADKWNTEWVDYYLPKYIAMLGQMATSTFDFSNLADDNEDLIDCLLNPEADEASLNAEIRRLLEKELKLIGLDSYVKDSHINEVKESIYSRPYSNINSNKLARSIEDKPYAARIALQALAELYVVNNPQGLHQYDSVKAKMQGWINGWVADTGNIWRKVAPKAVSADQIAKIKVRLAQREERQAQKTVPSVN